MQPSTSNSSTFNTPTSSAPSDSHALANADHEEKGTAQLAHHGGEVRDLGWNDHPADIPKPLVGGLQNDELWTLVRRFNKQIYHVKATNASPPGGLDLNIVEDEEFSPDKLRSNLERLYMTVIIGLMHFGKHIARIRSWREPRRTTAFAAVRLGEAREKDLIANSNARLMLSRGPSILSCPCYLPLLLCSLHILPRDRFFSHRRRSLWSTPKLVASSPRKPVF